MFAWCVEHPDPVATLREAWSTATDHRQMLWVAEQMGVAINEVKRRAHEPCVGTEFWCGLRKHHRSNYCLACCTRIRASVPSLDLEKLATGPRGTGPGQDVYDPPPHGPRGPYPHT
jgi:hypothetical protein